ncbi:MAG: hypothetical protein IJW92_02135 [Clostridia bacterium]|nr:hypothetical protein [Clostridia bacterium]
MPKASRSPHCGSCPLQALRHTGCRVQP